MLILDHKLHLDPQFTRLHKYPILDLSTLATTTLHLHDGLYTSICYDTHEGEIVTTHVHRIKKNQEMPRGRVS